MSSKLEVLTGSGFLSFSSVSTYLSCAEKYRLTRVERVPTVPSWALIAGKAVHTATELADTEPAMTAEQAWDKAWAAELAQVEDVAAVRATGRATKEWPNKEDAAYWTQHGPEHVQRWIDWREGNITQPKGAAMLGIEVPFHVEIAGVPVRGFIDRTLVDHHGQMIVLDLKSGSKTPDPYQLGVYTCALEAMGEPRPALGSYFMTRTGKVEMHAMARFTQEKVGRWLGFVQQAIELELFPPNTSSWCSSCDVRPHCTAWA